MARILIVDDDKQVRSLIRDQLSERYEIFDTGDPQQAFVMTLQHPPDAILLDLSMPGLSGFELCKALSSHNFTKRIPIFIVSGRDSRNKNFCQELGAVGYFEKPINFDMLKRRVAEALTSKRPELRSHRRVEVRVHLKLKGIAKNGDGFEFAALTENISIGGFLCSCADILEVGVAVEVVLCSESEFNLGSARVVGVEGIDTPHRRYRFMFTE